MKKMGKMILWIAAAALAAVLSMSVYQMYLILQERRAAEEVYEDLGRFVQLPVAGQEGELRQGAGGDAEPGQAGLDVAEGIGAAVLPEVDFDSLRAVNGQVVGWIYGEDTGISYPIAQASDNDYYLKRMFNGESNPSGAIFLDCRNQSDFSDSHCIIYGHHMKNGSMFAALSNYKSQEYFEDHPRMLLLTPGGNYAVEIFAGYVANVEDDAWVTGFASEADYEDWIAASLSKSLIRAGFAPSASDHVLTLSTCSYEFEDARFVLLGVLNRFSNSH